MHCPPRADQPDGNLPQNCDHSDRFAFPEGDGTGIIREDSYVEEIHVPRIIAPASRSFLTTPASSGTTDPNKAKEPAVVFIPEVCWYFRSITK